MKKLALATAAAAALMFTAPMFTPLAATPAEAQTVVKKKVVIKHHGDRGRHLGWRNGRGHHKTVIIKRGRGHGEHHGSKTVIKKKVIRGEG